MARKLLINAEAAEKSAPFIRSLTVFEPASNPVGSVIEESQLELEIKFAEKSTGAYAAWSGAVGESLEVVIGPLNDAPLAGTCKCTGGGNSTGGISSDISYVDTAAELKAAIAELDGIVATDLEVEKLATGNYQVEFVGDLADTDVSLLTFDADGFLPTSNVYVEEKRAGGTGENAIQSIRFLQKHIAYQDTWTPIEDGWSGSINLNTPQAQEALAGRDSSTGLQIEYWVTHASGRRVCYGALAFTLSAAVLKQGMTVPPGSPDYYTKIASDARYAILRFDLTALTGGGATALDYIVTAGGIVPVGTTYLLFIGGALTIWKLEANNTAEDGTYVVRPDDYADTTNEKIWQRIL